MSVNRTKPVVCGKATNPAILLDRGKGTTLTVHLVGAVITSWRVCNEEKIFVPVTADYSRYSRFRGGITLSFPYYPLCEIREEYELSRLYKWALHCGPSTTGKGNIKIVLLMKDDHWTRASWPHSFLFVYKITLKEKSIKLNTIILNPNPLETLVFRLHLETHFEVEKISNWRLDGIIGEPYCDKLASDIPHLNVYKINKGEELGKVQARIYQPPMEDSIFLSERRDICEVRKKGGEPFRKHIEFRRKNFPNLTVRYPWCLKEPNTDILAPDRTMPEANRDAICVGAGHVTEPKKLEGDKTYNSVVIISMVPIEQETVSMAFLEEPILFRQCTRT